MTNFSWRAREQTGRERASRLFADRARPRAYRNFKPDPYQGQGKFQVDGLGRLVGECRRWKGTGTAGEPKGMVSFILGSVKMPSNQSGEVRP